MATLLKEVYVGYVAGNWYLRLYEDSITQSIDGNYTTVNLSLTLRADASTWVSFDNRDAWIHGTHVTPAYRHDNSEHTIATTSIRINHNADGTGAYSVGFGISTSYAINGSGSGGRTLPTIPRASSFTISSNNTLGSAMSVSITRASSSFTHTVRYQFGTIVRDYTNQETSCTFTPPYEDGSQIPNATSGTGTITVYTYHGSTHIGTKSATFSVSVNATVFAPTVTDFIITRIDNGVPSAWGIYVQNKSKATAQIQGASAKYGANIASYAITIGSMGGGNNFTAGPFSSGTITIVGKVTDSRGLSNTVTKQITIYENTPPTLSMKAQRCNSAGTPNNNGTYIKITPTYSCASVNGKNYITSKTFKINGTSYQNTTSASGTSFILGNNDIAVSKAYVVSGSVSDALGQSSATIAVNIPTSSVPFHVREDQDGVAFGKYSENANSLESAWLLLLKQGLMISQNSVKATINNGNSSYTHYQTDASAGHYFNKNVYVNGEIYAGASYNKKVLYDGGTIGSLYASNWLRSTGQTGWYNESYGGGIYMNDATYVKVYNKKQFDVDNTCSATNFYIKNVPLRRTGYAISGSGPGDQNAICEITLVKSSSPYLQMITPYGGGGNAWGASVWASDIRLKKNITPITDMDALELIRKIQHFSFDWKNNETHIALGYVADYLQEQLPDAVFEVGDDKTKHINHTALIPLITLGIQQLEEKVLTQQNKIDELEKRIRALEKVCKN